MHPAPRLLVLSAAACSALTLAGCSSGAGSSSASKSTAATSGPVTPAAPVGVATGVTLPPADGAGNAPVKIRVPGWDAELALATPTSTATGPSGPLFAPTDGTFVGITASWDRQIVAGEGGPDPTNPSSMLPAQGNALDPLTGSKNALSAPIGVTMAVRAAGKSYPVTQDQTETVIALGVPAAKATLAITFDGVTQLVNLGTGKRAPNPVTDTLYTDTTAQAIDCPAQQVQTSTVIANGTCTAYTYPVAWSEKKGWATTGHVWQRVSVVMSGTLSLIDNGRDNTYAVTPTFTNPTLDAATPATGPMCTKVTTGTECSYLFTWPTTKRPATITGGLTLSGPATFRSSGPATATHTFPVTLSVPDQ